MAKNANTMLVCPEITFSEKPEMITVELSPNGKAYIVTIKVAVGLAETKTSKKGAQYTQSGVLKIDEKIEIEGVPYAIRCNSGWHNGKRVGDAEIVIVPLGTTTEKRVDTVDIGF